MPRPPPSDVQRSERHRADQRRLVERHHQRRIETAVRAMRGKDFRGLEEVPAQRGEQRREAAVGALRRDEVERAALLQEPAHVECLRSRFRRDRARERGVGHELERQRHRQEDRLAGLVRGVLDELAHVTRPAGRSAAMPLEDVERRVVARIADPAGDVGHAVPRHCGREQVAAEQLEAVALPELALLSARRTRRARRADTPRGASPVAAGRSRRAVTIAASTAPRPALRG